MLSFSYFLLLEEKKAKKEGCEEMISHFFTAFFFLYFPGGLQGQALLRHMGVSAYCCFLPDLTRFTGLHCAGPTLAVRRKNKSRRTRLMD